MLDTASDAGWQYCFGTDLLEQENVLLLVLMYPGWQKRAQVRPEHSQEPLGTAVVSKSGQGVSRQLGLVFFKQATVVRFLTKATLSETNCPLDNREPEPEYG